MCLAPSEDMVRSPVPIALAASAPFAQRRDLLRRESLRDFAGVAVAVATSALVWLTYLSFIRL